MSKYEYKKSPTLVWMELCLDWGTLQKRHVFFRPSGGRINAPDEDWEAVIEMRGKAGDVYRTEGVRYISRRAVKIPRRPPANDPLSPQAHIEELYRAMVYDSLDDACILARRVWNAAKLARAFGREVAA